MSRPAYGRAVRDLRDGSLIYEERQAVNWLCRCDHCQVFVVGHGDNARRAAVSALGLARANGWGLSVYDGGLHIRCPDHRDPRLESPWGVATADDLVAALRADGRVEP